MQPTAVRGHDKVVTARSSGSKDELRKAAEDFESIF